MSVIIPSAAGSRHLLACLNALERAAPSTIPFETIVIVNDAEPEALRRLDGIEGIRVEASPVNLGLAGAGNRGRSLARGELLILLHDDAEVEPGWLEGLIAAADAHPEAGAIGSRVLNIDGTLQNAGMILWRDGTTAPPWLERPEPAAFMEGRAVDYCGTSSLLVRAATWDAVGGLDERFYPVYYVDVDLAMAIRAFGQVVWYAPESRIRHHRGASTNRRWQIFLTARNREQFLQKWGAALEQHEPYVPRSLAAIECALARAAGNRGSTTPLPPREQRRETVADHELRHLKLALDVHKAFAKHLQEQLDAAEARPWAKLRRWLR